MKDKKLRLPHVNPPAAPEGGHFTLIDVPAKALLDAKVVPWESTLAHWRDEAEGILGKPVPSRPSRAYNAMQKDVMRGPPSRAHFAFRVADLVRELRGELAEPTPDPRRAAWLACQLGEARAWMLALENDDNLRKGRIQVRSRKKAGDTRVRRESDGHNREERAAKWAEHVRAGESIKDIAAAAGKTPKLVSDELAHFGHRPKRKYNRKV